MPENNNILVIKLSALGDFIQNLGIMRAIREHHRGANIILLTTQPYAEFAKKSGYFNNIIIDTRPKILNPIKWFKLIKALNQKPYETVYDLQINDRTALYYKLFKTKPDWVGELSKTSRNQSGLAFYRHKEILEKVGIRHIDIDKMEWLQNDITHFNLQEKYALIVPGCAPTRPEKRWPTEHYAELCQKIATQNIQPVIIGTKNEQEVCDLIANACPDALNLCGKTSLFDIVPLAREAAFAVGNDTGPMHMIAPTGCKTITLFSGHSDPERHRPLGDNVVTLQEQNIANITPARILEIIL